tara:strand:+ start:619 stop:1005 length:387 start_codon:yes stop_codon:yes gene_type:complete
MNKVILIKPDAITTHDNGSASDTSGCSCAFCSSVSETLEYEEQPTYEDIKEWIDGAWMEHIKVAIPTNNGTRRVCDAIIDEEGKLKGLPINKRATAAYWMFLSMNGGKPPFDDVIVGPCAICENFDLE